MSKHTFYYPMSSLFLPQACQNNKIKHNHIIFLKSQAKGPIQMIKYSIDTLRLLHKTYQCDLPG